MVRVFIGTPIDSGQGYWPTCLPRPTGQTYGTANAPVP
jgi:hypothetical protein